MYDLCESQQDQCCNVSPTRQMSFLPRNECGGDAVIEGPYRYRLRRWWSMEGKLLAWVLLNPSVADEKEDDAMLRRVISFTRREGYSRFVVVNLFAYRSPYPSELKQVADPIGPLNDSYLKDAFAQADQIVVGWGALGCFLGRDQVVLHLLEKPSWRLGLTTSHAPRHPLYVRSDAPLLPYTIAC